LASKHYLPSKIGNYFRRLELEYARSNRATLREVITAARVTVIEETAYDNWNGGTYGHDVILFLPTEIIRQIGFDEQEVICAELCKGLNNCARSVENESFRTVFLELEDESDADFQRAVNLAQQPHTNPNSLGIWKHGNLRLFISHRDTHKVAARQLAVALSSFGVSSFVAHDTIEPMSTWQREIEKGLETMEVMLAFLTDNFHESAWTNQEIGYALGKGVPIIAVKFEKKDPVGFIGVKQALRGDFANIERSAQAINRLLVEKLGQAGRLRQSLIFAFCSATNFNETRDRFDRLTETVSVLNEEEVDQIQQAFASNDQLHGAYYLTYHDRLINFLKRCTGKEFEINSKRLFLKKTSAKKRAIDDDIPF
jgi:hypothetical protein